MATRLAMIALVALALVPATVAAQSRWTIDVETGVAAGGYNDVRIPGDVGTDLSLTDDLDSDPAAFARLRLTRKLGGRHRISFLVAPLRLDGDGALPRTVRFVDATFDAGTAVESYYRFDSYRLTYAYDLYSRPRLRLAGGVTAKIRDAEIRLTSAAQDAVKTNTGFVPLLYFAGEWRISPRWLLLLEADALAAPQGRAEDVQLALVARVNDKARLRLGYRLLEGGADNDDVYTFALVHYVLAGLQWDL